MNTSSIYINISFLIILTDALLNYFLQTFYTSLPILAIIPVFLVCHIISNPTKIHTIDNNYLVFMGIGFFGYVIGIVTIDDVPLNRFLQIISAFSAWFVGYLWFVNKKIVNWNSVLFVTCIHSAVCIIALLKISPNYFPTEDILWSRGGILEIRPSVTTDQNIQIFYFLPIIGLILFYKTYKQFMIALVGLCMSAYTISSLQSRSGILILLGCLFVGLLLHLFCTNGKRARAIFLLSTFVFILIAVIIYRYDMIFLITARFTEHGFKTGFGRLHGLLYFFEKVWNIWWWIPRGSFDYIRITGNIPHSNITAQLLQGGIFAVVAWLALIVYPLFKIIHYQFLYKLDDSTAIVIIIAIGSLIGQLSLHVPLSDIIWLYGGLTAGAMNQSKRIKKTRRVLVKSRK